MSELRGVWTDERIDRMKALWAEGVNASQIAADLGGITRNSVLGKIHRLGLHRSKQSRTIAARVPKLKATATRMGPAKAPKPVALAVSKLERDPVSLDQSQADRGNGKFPTPSGAAEAIASLERAQCRFPIGDPLRKDFQFCSSAAILGKVYCKSHCVLAYALSLQPVLPPLNRSIRLVFSSKRARTDA